MSRREVTITGRLLAAPKLLSSPRSATAACMLLVEADPAADWANRRLLTHADRVWIWRDSAVRAAETLTAGAVVRVAGWLRDREYHGYDPAVTCAEIEAISWEVS